MTRQDLHPSDARRRELAKPDNPPAFPRLYPRSDEDGTCGMTLRDYFAAAAINGIYASGPEGMETDDITKLPLKDWAKCAYAQADAMLKERAKP